MAISFLDALGELHRPLRVDPETATLSDAANAAFVSPIRLEHLGSPEFCTDHGIRYPYYAGAMANGIGSAELVEAMSRAGLLGMFGAAGLTPPVVEAAIDRLQRNLPDSIVAGVGTPTPAQPRGEPGSEDRPRPRPAYGFNLIHSPNEPTIEKAVADLFIKRGIHLVEASAYLGLTLPIVKYRVHGIHRDPSGRIVTPNRVIAKVSRVEVASKFFAPPPAEMLRELVNQGFLATPQAEMAMQVPMAQDVTAEADSAGHTDNRPAITLLPTMLALRNRMQEQYHYADSLRVGAAGGIATPASAAAAFTMGAAYIATGSVNQACVESGSSVTVRQMLAEAEQADTIMAPAADMFEMGVKLQVLKRGTMFAMRAAKLYELYRACDSLERIPPADRAMLEKTIFRASLDEIWQQTKAFFLERDPGQIQRAEKDAKHKMALVFRWYLGQSSRWANRGEPSRKIDYQVWCGPAMGAFNEWTRGSFLEKPANRRVVTVAMNILYGAAVLLRAASLRFQGVKLPADFPRVSPLELDKIHLRLAPASSQNDARALNE